MNFATTKQRILEFIDFKGISITNFLQETNIRRGFLDGDKLESSVSDVFIARIIAAYPELNIEWLITGEGNMLKHCGYDIIHEKSVSYKNETRPRIPMDAAAGSLTLSADGIILSDCEQIPVIETLPKYDFTIFARGDSMETEFHSGDELACLFIKQSSFIQWGRIHILDTAQGIIAKSIFEAGDYILCKSYNESYKEFNIHKSELFNIALVVGLIRRY